MCGTEKIRFWNNVLEGGQKGRVKEGARKGQREWREGEKDGSRGGQRKGREGEDKGRANLGE